MSISTLLTKLTKALSVNLNWCVQLLNIFLYDPSCPISMFRKDFNGNVPWWYVHISPRF